MKLSTCLFASATVVLAITACTAPSSEEDVDTSSQALCPRGQDCTKPKNRFDGIAGGDLVAVDPAPTTPQTFACEGQLVASDPCTYLRPDCPASDPNNCKCEKFCRLGNGPGGGFAVGTWSPCLAGHTYTCNYLGQCRCN
jgi:hypothetical protein